MKNCFLIFLVSCSQIAFGQKILFKNETRNLRSDVLFNSIYNCVTVMIENTSCTDINLKSDNLDIQKGDSCAFYLKVKNPHKAFTLSIYKKGDSITTKSFLGVDNDIPLPLLSIGCGVSEYGSLLCSRADTVFCKPFLYDGYNEKVNFKVVSFILTALRESDEEVYKEFIVGNRISNDSKRFIKTLRQYDRMILSKVLIVDDNKNYYTIDEKEFVVF